MQELLCPTVIKSHHTFVFTTFEAGYMTQTHIICKDTEERTACLFSMEKENDTVVEEKLSHWCCHSCLGPLTFHCKAVGEEVSLSHGFRLATRRATTFKNGLVFSSRPLKIQERICLKLGSKTARWHGALRVGFTNVHPTARSLPLPPMAIPDLTEKDGHWAAPVPEHLTQAGLRLELWVSKGGSMYIQSNDSITYKLLSGVDLSKPLWAVIDLYAQTKSVFLLGSEKKEIFCTRRSCPAPECDTLPKSFFLDVDESMSHFEMKGPEDGMPDCVVCMAKKARIVLPCGHQCLCYSCTTRVVQEFGTCPLCRLDIDWTEDMLRNLTCRRTVKRLKAPR